MHIRKMVLEDVEAVYEIEKRSYTTSWSKRIFKDEVIHNAHAWYAVVEYKEEIVGYAGMWVVYDDAQITNIAIDPSFRGRRFGERLFRFMFQSAVALQAERLSLEVRVSNVIAQKMYRKFGLVPGGIRKGYYTDNNEDAVVMWVNIK